MVNGTEWYLLHTWCCTKWRINHPLPSPFSTLLSDFCPSDQIMPHGSAKWPHPHLFFHSDYPIRLSPELLVLQYIKTDLKSHRDLSLMGKKRDLAVAPSDIRWTDGLRGSPASKRSSTLQDGVGTANGAKQRKVTGATWGESANEGKNIGQNQGLRWHHLGKTPLGLLH